MLHDIGIRKHAKMDWWGNLLFAVGLISILVGITYGLQPYGGHPMGWTSPMVLGMLFCLAYPRHIGSVCLIVLGSAMLLPSC